MTIVEMPSSHNHNQEKREPSEWRMNSRGNSQSSSDKIKPHCETLLRPFILHRLLLKRNIGETF